MSKTWQNFRGLTALVALAGLPLLAGCGGGSGGGGTAATAPSTTTRAAAIKIQKFALRAFTNGAPTNSAFSINALGTSPNAGTGAVSGTAGATGSNGVTLFGGYLNSLRPSNNANGAAASSRAVKRHSRDASAPFYYDEWLALWVDTLVSDGTNLSQKFYVDEAKSVPAGSLTATLSAANVYPIVGTYQYAYTAGTLNGTSGSLTYTSNADNSGKFSYSSVNSDGWKYKGDATQNADGSSAWTDRTDSPDGSYSTDSGTFRADGSSVTTTTTSDGYTVTFNNNADGSATGKITGPGTGLPATIVRDANGNTTITYADGTTDTLPGWTACYNGDTGTISSDGGSTGSGSESGNSSGSAGSTGGSSGNPGPPAAPPI